MKPNIAPTLPDCVTTEYLDDLLARSDVGVFQPDNTTTVVCTVELPNGFCAVGTFSSGSTEGCTDGDFDERDAINRALFAVRKKVAELEGYLLHQRRYEAALGRNGAQDE